MAFVRDAPVSLCRAFDDEDHLVASKIRNRLLNEEAPVSSPWWFEMRNILIVNGRRNRLTTAGMAAFLRDFAEMPIIIDRAPEETAVRGLARNHRRSVYDAAYLELAFRDWLPVATRDTTLAKAVRADIAAVLDH